MPLASNCLNGERIEQFNVDGNFARDITGPDQQLYAQYVLDSPYDVMMNYAAQQWATDLAMPLIPRLRHRANVLAPCGYSALDGQAGLRSKDFFNYFQHFLPRYLPFYDAAVCHSELYQDFEYARKFKLTNHLVIPNAVDETEFEKPLTVDFRQKYGITEKHLLLCVANFVNGKGQERVINALRRLNRSDTVLVLIGKSGPVLPALQTWSKGLNVKYLTDIPRADTISAFRSADLFVFASHLEASPLVILEAKASKLAFVSTDVGNVREWKGGCTCSPDEMSKVIGTLLDNPPARQDLAKQGWTEYQQKHTWKAVTNRYEDLYSRLVAAKRGKSSAPSAFVS